MKKSIYVLALALAVAACKEEAPKDYVTLSGRITNQNSDSLIVAQRGIIKTIKVDKDGSFLDTLKVESGNYILFDGKEQAALYLKNGYSLNITTDTKQFDETLKFSGVGHEANNYLAQKSLLSDKIVDFQKILALDKAGFDGEMAVIKDSFKNLLDTTQGLDSTFVASQEKDTEGLKQQLLEMYEKKQVLNGLKGQESPKFINYENDAGGTTSLNDLKGKYVYIDIWATWCGPCKREIPFLKEVENTYHDKNIAFVSISLDQEKDRDKWKQMIVDKELGGLQLFADNNWKSTFVKDYAITGIPRFILIDPEGKVVSADAPRPSDETLIDLFNELNI